MMRKAWLLLIWAAAGTGCLSPGTHVEKEAHQTPPVRLADVPPPPPTVNAEQITEGNANEAVRAMAKELDYDAAARPAMAPNANLMKP